MSTPNILIVKNGDTCPRCNYKQTKKVLIDIQKGKDTYKINVYQCRCGCLFTNNALLRKQKQITRYDLDNIKIISPNKKDIKQLCCVKCGSPEVFSGTNMCWSCYKEEKENMYL